MGSQTCTSSMVHKVRSVATPLSAGFPPTVSDCSSPAPTSLTNGPPFLELQSEWIVQAICKQRDEKLATVEANAEAEKAWRQKTLEMADMTLAVETKSWYMGANIPGKKREYLLYMGGLPAWHQACIEALEGWKGFEVNARR